MVHGGLRAQAQQAVKLQCINTGQVYASITFPYVPLAKASHVAYPDSRRREIYSTSLWEDVLTSHM